MLFYNMLRSNDTPDLSRPLTGYVHHPMATDQLATLTRKLLLGPPHYAMELSTQFSSAGCSAIAD